MRIFIERIEPNEHILWCRECNEVRMGIRGKCTKCHTVMWNVHKYDALSILAHEACNPGSNPPELLRLAQSYVGKDEARRAAETAIAEMQAKMVRRAGKEPCTRGHHRRAPDWLCDYCGEPVCCHMQCGSLAVEDGLCGRHHREMKAIQERWAKQKRSREASL